ncbi:MAG: sulfatase, partial [Planctomycetota bacterium]
MARLTCTLLFSLLAIVPLAHADATDASRPNVIFIVADDLNDMIEGYDGHAQVITPNLARFAETGTTFTHAYCTSTVCAPSRASFMSGIHAHNSRNLWFDWWHKNEALANSHIMPSFFRENGYYAAGSGKVSHTPLRSAWDEWENDPNYGPHAWDGTKRVGNPHIPKPFSDGGKNNGGFGPTSLVPFEGEEGKGWVASPGNTPPLWRYVSEDDRDPTPDEANAQWAADFIDAYPSREIDKPFFLAVGFIRPHSPTHAPDRFFDMYPLDDVELLQTQPGDMDDTGYPAVFPLDKRGYHIAYQHLIKSYSTATEGLKRFVQSYLACVTAMDENVGQVLDALERSPYRDNTIVVFTSDHGMHLGEKEHLFKLTLWEESARVPLIVRVPGMTEGGSVVNDPVSLIDLFPTLIDLCGLEGDTRMSDKGLPLDGHSFKPLLEDPENGTWDGPDAALTFL